MELLQCMIGPKSNTRRSCEDDVYDVNDVDMDAARAVQSADRDLERRVRRKQALMEVPARVRRQSLPAARGAAHTISGQTAAESQSRSQSERFSATLPHQSAQRKRVDSGGSGGSGWTAVRRTSHAGHAGHAAPTVLASQGLPHWGSSLSLASENSVSELTSRTLLPPPSPVQRRASTPTRAGTPTRQARPSLPQMRAEVQSPCLADYLAKPRLVRSPGGPGACPPTLACPSHHHTKRLLAGAEQGLRPNYRNLRLGNFMEGENVSEGELIPEMLRQYYLDTFLGSCDTCESATHVNPMSPIQRGM